MATASKSTGLSGVYTGLISETSQIDPILRSEAIRRNLLTPEQLTEVWAVEYMGALTFRLFSTDGSAVDLFIY